MKKFFNFLLEAKWSVAVVLLVSLVLVSSCKKEDDPAENPIAAFQFTVGTDNYLEVTFDNYSQNAVSYAWEFGDGQTSTEESPVHVYDAAGTYTVKLTATGAEGTTPATKSETVTLNDPNEQLTLLAGASSKKWYLDRQGIALGIGPNINDNSWWSFGGVTPLGDRPCIMDDYYVFHRDGTFESFVQGTVFVDSYGNGGWLDAEACVSEGETDKLVGEAGEDLSVYVKDGSFTFEFDPTVNSLSILGEGAYIGLPNKTNGGDNYVPISLKEYTIFNFVDGATVDSLHMGMVGDGFVWNFYLVSYENEADIPEIPSAEPAAGFSFSKDGFTVTFNNTSKNATSYSWDFGDGGSSTEKNPVYTYGAEGTYTVTLTAMDNSGNSSVASQDVTLSAVVFTPEVLSSAAGKVWKLSGAGCYYVGDAIGSGAWWPGFPEAELDAKACIMDDEFIFFDNGDYVFDSKGAVFAEGYMGGANNCINDEDLVAPYDGLGSGTFTFEVIPATDTELAKIKVIGNGAYIGFSKAFNGGEYSGADAALSSEITYTVYDYSVTDEKEIMVVSVDIAPPGWWNMRIESIK